MNYNDLLTTVSKFNHVESVDTYNFDTMLISFKELPWEKNAITHVRYFEKIIQHSDRPFIKALKQFYQTDNVTTVFLTRLKHKYYHLQQIILVGNKRILIPNRNGDVHLVITSMLLKNLQFMETDSCLKTHEGHVVFLDPYQTPYPGGSYYEDDTNNYEYKRVCIITKDVEKADRDIYMKWLQENLDYRKKVISTKSVQVKLPDLFFTPNPIENIHFSDDHLINTQLINKKYSVHDPDFLIQDILNTYHKNNYNINTNLKPLKNVALFIEYPMIIDFENDHSFCSSYATGTRWIPFLVNSSNPKKVLQVRRPYDRYYEYENMDFKSVSPNGWTKFYYIPNITNVWGTIHRVIIGNVVLGHKYNQSFLCYEHPMLIETPLSVDSYEDEGVYELKNIRNTLNYHTDCLLNPIEDFAHEKDDRIEILSTYKYNDEFDICKVKHRALENETWCLVRTSASESCKTGSSFLQANNRNSDDDEPSPKYFKKALPPLTSFVAAWVEFFMENRNKKHTVYGDLNVFKLAAVLARHKICFKMKVSDKREIDELNGSCTFYMEQKAIDFINDMRLMTNTKEIENEEKNCIIL